MCISSNSHKSEAREPNRDPLNSRMNDQPMGTFAGPPLRCGVNLGGWLSQADLSPTHVEGFIREDDIQRIAEWGMDHIRVPIDYLLLHSASTGSNGIPKKDAVAVLHRLGEWVERADLCWILDLHEMPNHSFNTPESNSLWRESSAAADLSKFWIDLLADIGTRSNLVIDLLNEPAGIDPAGWRRVVTEAIEEIRRAAPDLWLIAESADKGNPALISQMPESPPEKCLYSFHFYEPLAFTHQLAWWSDVLPYAKEPQPYPGWMTPTKSSVPERFGHYFDREWNRETLKSFLFSSAKWAQERGVRLHCGEFGAYLKGPCADRYRWLQDVIDLFLEFEIGWSYWSYKNMGFGVLCDIGDEARLPEYAGGIDPQLLKIISRHA